MGGVNFFSQLIGTLLAIVYALAVSVLVYVMVRNLFGFRMTDEDEFSGPDLRIHHVNAYPEDHVR